MPKWTSTSVGGPAGSPQESPLGVLRTSWSVEVPEGTPQELLDRVLKTTPQELSVWVQGTLSAGVLGEALSV